MMNAPAVRSSFQPNLGPSLRPVALDACHSPLIGKYELSIWKAWICFCPRALVTRSHSRLHLRPCISSIVMNSNQLPLIPDIYRVGCLPGGDKVATLYLDHANVDQPVLVKGGVEDLPAQEVRARVLALLSFCCHGSTDLRRVPSGCSPGSRIRPLCFPSTVSRADSTSALTAAKSRLCRLFSGGRLFEMT